MKDKNTRIKLKRITELKAKTKLNDLEIEKLEMELTKLNSDPETDVLFNMKVLGAILQGDKILAIKKYRELHACSSCGLREAKDDVRELIRILEAKIGRQIS